jgi:hypothetical protein
MPLRSDRTWSTHRQRQCGGSAATSVSQQRAWKPVACSSTTVVTTGLLLGGHSCTTGLLLGGHSCTATRTPERAHVCTWCTRGGGRLLSAMREKCVS